jgi:hypothetical protein
MPVTTSLSATSTVHSRLVSAARAMAAFSTPDATAMVTGTFLMSVSSSAMVRSASSSEASLPSASRKRPSTSPTAPMARSRAMSLAVR